MEWFDHKKNYPKFWWRHKMIAAGFVDLEFIFLQPVIYQTNNEWIIYFNISFQIDIATVRLCPLDK